MYLQLPSIFSFYPTKASHAYNTLQLYHEPKDNDHINNQVILQLR